MLYVQNPSKPEVGSSLVSEGGGEMAGRVVVFVAGWEREAIKKIGNFRISGKRLENLYKVCLSH